MNQSSKTSADVNSRDRALMRFLIVLVCIILALVCGFFAFLIGVGVGGDERVSRNAQHEQQLIDRHQKDSKLLDKMNAELGGRW